MVETGSGQAINPAQRLGEADEQPHGLMQCPVGLYSGCSRLTHGAGRTFGQDTPDHRHCTGGYRGGRFLCRRTGSV